MVLAREWEQRATQAYHRTPLARGEVGLISFPAPLYRSGVAFPAFSSAPVSLPRIRFVRVAQRAPCCACTVPAYVARTPWVRRALLPSISPLRAYSPIA